MLSKGTVIKWHCRAIMSVMNGVINKGQLVRRGQDGVSRHLVDLFESPIDQQMDFSNRGLYCIWATAIFSALFITLLICSAY